MVRIVGAASGWTLKRAAGDMAEFEWDEAKRLLVLRRRNLDFGAVEMMFDGRTLLTRTSNRGIEERWISVGDLDGRLVAIVWTKRGESIRIITMRSARDEEKRQYRQLHV